MSLPSGSSRLALSLVLFVVSGLLTVAIVGFSIKRQTTGDLNLYEFREGDHVWKIRGWHAIDDFAMELAQFETVFWDPADTVSLRAWIEKKENVQGKQVLEVGTGTGLVALCCLKHGAKQVVATDINPSAVANASYNAQHVGLDLGLETRLTPLDKPGAFSSIGPEEKFDLIISNPPWEDEPVHRIDQFALYDPGFRLCDSLLEQGGSHLSSQGKMLLVYGAQTAIRHIQETAPRCGWTVKILDDRSLETLPEVFVPAMLLELTPIQVRNPD